MISKSPLESNVSCDMGFAVASDSDEQAAMAPQDCRNSLLPMTIPVIIAPSIFPDKSRWLAILLSEVVD